MSQNNYGKTLKTIAKSRKKKEKWIRTRMWFSTFISMLYNDRGIIPPNIGNNILVLNNMYITKNSMSAFILIKEFSDDTPKFFTSDMLYYVKDKVNNVTIDVTFKNKKHYIDTSSSGMKSRVETWERTLDNPYSPEYLAKRAARCLYTRDIIKSGKQIFKTRTYITIRADNGKDLSRAINEVSSYLGDIGASYYVVKSDMREHLQYASLVSDKMNKQVKDVPYSIMTFETLAESLPSLQGGNDTDGTFMGIDKRSMSPYYISFRLSANAKNIYICSRSGFGKTFLAQNWLIDMYTDDYNLCIMDIKGELGKFTAACHGITMSMRPESGFYMNTFAWKKDEIRNLDPIAYCNKMLGLSKRQIMIISDLKEEYASQGEALVEEFFQYLYTMKGALADNINTWYRTESLDPFTVYEEFDKYLSVEVLSKYENVATKMKDRCAIFWSRTGSNRHMFTEPYSYKDIYDTKVLTFDFGLIDNTSKPNPIVFKLKVLYMEMLNDEFVSYKKSRGEWTVKMLEESQIVDNYITEIYTREITLSRARNQINILLGNSSSSLADNPKAKAMLENINILVLGVLYDTSINYFVKEFSLTEDDEDTLNKITSDPDYENTFLMVNKMQKDATKPLLHVYVPDRVRDGKLFKVVDTVDE
jgi:hypothetical protein